MKAEIVKNVREVSFVCFGLLLLPEWMTARVFRLGVRRALQVLGILLFVQNASAGFPLTILGALNGFSDGDEVVGLTPGLDGDVYGVANINGKYGDGTIFKMTPSGAITILANFDGTNGADPNGPVIQAADGNFYG